MSGLDVVEIHRSYPRTEIALQKYADTKKLLWAHLYGGSLDACGETLDTLKRLEHQTRTAYMLDTNLPWEDCSAMNIHALRQIVEDWRKLPTRAQRLGLRASTPLTAHREASSK